MGYDIVRLNEKGEAVRITELNDDDYFRLNVWGMSEMRRLAAWGVDAISNQEVAEMFEQKTERKSVKNIFSELVSAMTETNAISEKTAWLEPFSSNGNDASREDCWSFAEALTTAVDKITASPVRPDINLDYVIDFIDYLNNSPNGVYVG